MLSHSFVAYLRAYAGDPSLARTFAHSAPADRSRDIYIIVDPANLIDNGEVQGGQVSPKKSMIAICIYGRSNHTLLDLAPYAKKIKTALSSRLYEIDGYHIAGTLLKNEVCMDATFDPQGGETGVPSIQLFYSVNHRELPTT